MPRPRHDHAPATSPWPSVIEPALHEMDTFLRTSDWHGRENEVVNLFAHRFLAARVAVSGPLRSLRQVGIEVAVPQVTGSPKKYVRKDLVIWPEEDMTAWTGEGIPAVVMEWKRDREEACRGDIAWLEAFCGRYPGVIGYSVCAMLTGVCGCSFLRVGG